MTRTTFFVGFGFLPLWLVIAASLVILGGKFGAGVVMPYLILAAIPACGVTMFIAGTTLARHSLAPGDQTEKLNSAKKFFWVQIFIVAVIAGVWWANQIWQKNASKRQESRAIEFVKTHPLTVRNGGKVGARVALTKTAGDRTVLGYEIPTSLGYAIVSITRQPSGPEFTLECIAKRSIGKREAFKNPCEQGPVLIDTPGTPGAANAPSVDAPR